MKQAAFSLAAGLLLSLSFTAAAATLYVNVNNPAPAAPYTNWVTAATNIQAAVDASTAGDEVVVTDGVYQTGGKLAYGGATTNRVAVDKPITVRSVNGPTVTVIRGQQAAGGGSGFDAVRCVYLTNGAVLAGFTLTNGATAQQDVGGGVLCPFAGGALLTNCTLGGNSANLGGGAYSGTLNHCTLIGNSAVGTSFRNSAGGGVFAGTLNNCTLTANSADTGGGAAAGTLNNCTLTANSATSTGGGAVNGTLNNCIVWYNTAPSGSNYDGGTLNYCCTAPCPAGALVTPMLTHDSSTRRT